MSDIFTKEKRSYIMSKVSRYDTPQEILVRKFLFSKGFRFRKNYRKLPGSPDIVLPKLKVVIFIHGCFWHGHNCKPARLPKSNTEFWDSKINSNKERDDRKSEELRKLGWQVVLLWQCELSNKKKENNTLKGLLKKLLRECEIKNILHTSSIQREFVSD